MNNNFKNVLLIILVILSGFFIWYFFRIFLYLMVSAVISLLGQPLVEFLQRIRIGQIRIPLGVSAFITLLIIIGLFAGFFSVLFPLLASQAALMADLDMAAITTSIEIPLSKTETFLHSWNLLKSEETISGRILAELSAIATFEKFSGFFNSVLNLVIEVFFGFLAISFITYFFLKEQRLFSSIVLFFTPQPHRSEASEILAESKVLLRRYFAGLFTDLAAVFFLITLCMWIIGLPNALVIGFFAGILNVIPYVGPIIATFIGVFLGVSVNLQMDFYSEMLPMVLSIIASFIIVNTIDIGVLQPLIFSKSVKSHPLEIFIVFIIAGMIGGVFGMIAAIPAYSVLRIFGKQFYMKSRLVQGLRESINNPSY